MKRAAPAVARSALDLVGGTLPVGASEFAARAHAYVMDPCRSTLKAAMDASPSVRESPPFLGIFCDIPWHQLRESEVKLWARAGFAFIIADGEHSAQEGRLGREQFSMLSRHGLTPIQRLHREARSAHGDALCLGARGTMAPYGSNLGHLTEYLQCVDYPKPGAATPHSRGGYPMRAGDYSVIGTPKALRAAEAETTAWVQFETTEYILDAQLQSRVLETMAAHGPNRTVAFVGPLDAAMTSGHVAGDALAEAMDGVMGAAADKGVWSGRVVAATAPEDPESAYDGFARAIGAGGRMLCPGYLASDLAYYGARAVAAPFFRAAADAGFC